MVGLCPVISAADSTLQAYRVEGAMASKVCVAAVSAANFPPQVCVCGGVGDGGCSPEYSASFFCAESKNLLIPLNRMCSQETFNSQ